MGGAARVVGVGVKIQRQGLALMGGKGEPAGRGGHGVGAGDIDPQALRASDDNAAENEVEDRIELADPAELPAALTVDILIANILAGVLIRLCLLYTSPSPRDRTRSRMPSSA